MTKAYSYIRMSTKEQMKGDSARRQLEMTKRYAAENDLDLQDSYDDIGVPAFRSQNSGGGKLAIFLDLVRKGKIDKGSYLIVESLDRLSRDKIPTAFAQLNDIILAGIIVVTLTDGQIFSEENSGNDQMSLMIALSIMMRAHEESKIKSQRLSAAWSQKRKSIQSGSVTKQRIPAWLRYSTDQCEILKIEDRVIVIRRIFEMARDGWGAFSIARHLNSTKQQTWGRSKMWHESYVKKILASRAVLGEFQPHKIADNAIGKRRRIADGNVVIGYYPDVIDHILFEEAQLAVSRRFLNGAGRKGGLNRNIFSGLLRCGLCKSGMRFLDKGNGPKGGTYLRCSLSLLKGNCSAPAWRYLDVENALMKSIRQIDFEAVLDVKTTSTELSKLATDRAKILKRIAEIKSRIKNVLEAIQTASAPIELLTGSLGQLEVDLADAQSEEGKIRVQTSKLEKLNPIERQAALDKILAAIGEADADDDISDLRKKLSAELRLALVQINIAPTLRELWEDRDAGVQWIKELEMLHSGEQLERVVRRYSFVVFFIYHNGDTQEYDPLTKENVLFRSSNKMNLMRRKANLPI